MATEQSIVHQLCQEGWPFSWRQNFCCVPNVSYGLLPWEADLLVCTKAGFQIEVEVKVSAADWRGDSKKKKFLYRNDPALAQTPHVKAWTRIRDFWYAAPMELAAKWESMGIPEWAGVMGVNPDAARWMDGYKLFRPPVSNRKALKLTDLEKAHLARLGSIRVWTAKPTQPTEKKP